MQPFRFLAPLLALVLVASTLGAAASKKSRSRKPRPSAPAAPESSGLVHTPLTEQVVLTPLPIWVETHDESASRVILRYKVFGAPSWTAIDMTKSEGGWAGEIPCREVGTITGVLRYYITAYDKDGNVVGTFGNLKKPTAVRIRRTISGPPPHFPGRPPPARCADTTDCPPGFPGCSSKPSGKNGCMSDDDCEEGTRCGKEQTCEAPPSEQRRNWITLGILQDVVFMNNGNYCAPENQDSGQFSCLRQSDGAPYFGTPQFQDPALAYGPATARIFLGYDYFVATHFALGVRAGYVVRGLAPALDNRKASLPILAEGRIAYWFNVDSTVRPLLFVSGGYSPIDFKFQTYVREDTSVTPTQPNPDTQTLDVWTTRGPWFAGGGLGVMFATSNATGFILELEGAATFPKVSTIVRPDISFAVGF